MEVKNFIKLDNEKYIFLKDEMIENNNQVLLFNIMKDNLKTVSKVKNLLFIIDFKIITNYKKTLKEIIKIKRICKKNKIKIGVEEQENVIIGYLKNYDCNSTIQKDLISAINAIFYNNSYNRYNYLYDKICEYLDNEFIQNNLCDFKEDKCIAKRNTNCTMGCCYHFKNKILFPFVPNKLVLCEYLKDKKCSVKCISCKLYTCGYLNKKGIKYKLNQIFLVKYFFNPIQKLILKIKVFTPKEKILKQILLFNFRIM